MNNGRLETGHEAALGHSLGKCLLLFCLRFGREAHGQGQTRGDGDQKAENQQRILGGQGFGAE